MLWRGIARFREIRAGATRSRGRPQFQQTTCEHADSRGRYLGLARLRPGAPGAQPDAVSQARGLAKAGGKNSSRSRARSASSKGDGGFWVIAPVYHAGRSPQATSDGMSPK
jgi:hypothetical protein